MFSFIGILLGLGLFIFLAIKGYHLVLSALGCTCVMLAFSGLPPYEGVLELYLPALADFVQRYFLLFLFSSLIGRLMGDGGSARRISLALAHLIGRSRNNRRFFCSLLVPVLYFFLCYVGISGFVVVFTVLPIAKSLYVETDTPWQLYCCGGAQSVSAAMLSGSLHSGNVYAADYCHTPLTAGLGLSLLATGVFWGVSLVMLRVAVNRLERRGEGFLPTGAGILEAHVEETIPEEELPGLLPSLFPLVTVVVLAAGFGLPVVPVLLLGCLLTALICRKNLARRWKETLAQGTTASFGPILCVAATYAIGVVLKGLEGFGYLEAGLSALPHLLQGSGLGLVAAFVMASVTAPIPAFADQMLSHYTAAGLSTLSAHRMMTITAFTSIAPHNAGISNAATVLHLPFGRCLRTYMLYTYVPGFCALGACWGAVALGLIH